MMSPQDHEALKLRFVLAGFSRRLVAKAEAGASLQSMRDDLDQALDAFMALAEHHHGGQKQKAEPAKPQPATPIRPKRQRKPRAAPVSESEAREAA